MSLESTFATSLIYGGFVLMFIAILMTTAANKTPTEIAFTLREWFLAVLFGSIGFLLLVNLSGEVQYMTGTMVALDIIMTLILFALFRSHLRWRRRHGNPLDAIDREDHPIRSTAHGTEDPGDEPRES